MADTPLLNPTSPKKKINVTGVIDKINWEGGPADPMSFCFRVSRANKAILEDAISSGQSELKAEFVVYDFDHTEKKHFKYFHTNDKQIPFEITEATNVKVLPEPDTEIQKPINYQVLASLTGKNNGEVHIAYSANAPFTRRLGTELE